MTMVYQSIESGKDIDMDWASLQVSNSIVRDFLINGNRPRTPMVNAVEGTMSFLNEWLEVRVVCAECRKSRFGIRDRFL